MADREDDDEYDDDDDVGDDAVADADKDFEIRQTPGLLVTLFARLKTAPGTGHFGTA